MSRSPCSAPGISRRRGQIPAAAELSVLRPVPQAGSSRPIWCSRCTPSARSSPTSRSSRTSTTIRSPVRTRRCFGVLRGRHRGRGGPSTWRTTCAAGIGVHRPARPAQRQQRRTSRRWLRVDRSGRARWYARLWRQTALAPRLPTRLTYRRSDGGARLQDRRRHRQGHATYRLLSGPPIELAHHGEEFTLHDQPVSLPIPRSSTAPRPRPPPGCEPYQRSV